MKKQRSRWGCAIAGLLVVMLLVIGGGWWYLRSQNVPIDTTPTSPVLVFIVSPPSGDEMDAGDFVTVNVQAVAPEPIQSTELFLDGQSLGKVTDPSNASWTWQAWPLGVHSFYAQATDANGQVGYSQVVVVNVLAGDGILQTVAQEGQTLEQIGAGYGVPPDQMAGANPKTNPSQPLQGGQPVKIPIGNGGAGNGSGQGSGQGQTPAGGSNFIPYSITWTFKLIEPADESYCYTSIGNGIWEKMPKPPFNFLDDFNPYTQFDLTFPSQKSVIQAQCWGWLAGVLKFLGQGEAQLDVLQPPSELIIDGGGFVLTGIPQIPPIEEEKFLGGGGSVPPPYALREPSSVQDCASHGDPIAVPLLCNGIMNAKVKENIVLVWEWKPEVCLPGFCKYGKYEIAGFGIYEIDPYTQSHVLIANIKPSLMKVAFPPLPWGKCFGVEAYVDYPGSQVSEMVTYCPGDPPKAQKITLTPTNWLTTGDLSDSWYDELGNPAGAVVVSASNFGSETRSSAAVKFAQPVLPPGAVIQKATLKFSILWTDYFAHGVAANYKPLCVASVGKAKQDWTGLDGGENHYLAGKNTLSSSAYNEPLTSLPEYAALSLLEVDVTPVLKDWINKNNPLLNYGFIFAPRPSLETIGEGGSFCESGLGNFQLEIYYFAP